MFSDDVRKTSGGIHRRLGKQESSSGSAESRKSCCLYILLDWFLNISSPIFLLFPHESWLHLAAIGITQESQMFTVMSLSRLFSVAFWHDLDGYHVYTIAHLQLSTMHTAKPSSLTPRKQVFTVLNVDKGNIFSKRRSLIAIEMFLHCVKKDFWTRSVLSVFSVKSCQW